MGLCTPPRICECTNIYFIIEGGIVELDLKLKMSGAKKYTIKIFPSEYEMNSLGLNFFFCHSVVQYSARELNILHQQS